MGLVSQTGSMVGTDVGEIDYAVCAADDEEPWDDQFEQVAGITAQDTVAGIRPNLPVAEQARFDDTKNWGETYCLGGRSD